MQVLCLQGLRCSQPEGMFPDVHYLKKSKTHSFPPGEQQATVLHELPDFKTKSPVIIFFPSTRPSVVGAQHGKYPSARHPFLVCDLRIGHVLRKPCYPN